MLDSQINLYSIDTGHFYSNREAYLHRMNHRYRRERNYLKQKLPALEQSLQEAGYSPKELLSFKDGSYHETELITESAELVREYAKWHRLIQHKQEKAKESKSRLLSLLANKAAQNEMTGGRDHVRSLRKEDIHDHHIVSVFESALTRAIGIQTDELSDAVIVIQVYYFDVFKDLSFWGFRYNGELYQYYTSSAGQIRKKKAVFIKESVWKKVEKTIMCGLTIERINSKGGNNVNKHLAYMALSNSATDQWKDFDIDRCIVVPDFETKVHGRYDFIDDTDYSITRKTGSIPINHTDGAGMMLPSVMKRNTMFRAPWIKGLLGVFDFRKFIEVNHCSPVITDIYGQAHDVMAEDIQIIFTKSQFKMYPFYDSWDEYKKHFKAYQCQAGLCNIEETRIKPAKINYQMLQTITDITDEEIGMLASKSAEKITGLCSSETAMMNALGITPYNTNMTTFQKAVKLYPSLLSDTYTKDLLREIKNSLLKKYRSGKLEINGKYTFLLPDFYAACEFWFGKNAVPKGLLGDGEVFCWLYRNYARLDCLRSPHLYREHAIRSNAANQSEEGRAETIRTWFTTDALYTSTHDLISKLLQFDVDGDQSLVVADPDFIRIAERNMEGIVPLYYSMRKAEPAELTRQSIYAGLNAAFTGGNIGTYSNHISKIWNNEVFLTGTEEEKAHALDCIKRLCCQNNYVIDFAKTLYKPEFPAEIEKDIKTFTNCRLPAFFEFAKDKEQSQIEARNASLVNQLYDRIPDKPINTRGLKLDRLDYRKLMNDESVVCSKEAAALYDTVNREYRYMINLKDEYIDNLHYVACCIRDKFAALGHSEEVITDMLVQYLYGSKKRAKQLLWFCYGSQILSNLEQHIIAPRTKYMQCTDCGEWQEVNVSSRRIRCDSCQEKKKSEHNKNMYRARKFNQVNAG